MKLILSTFMVFMFCALFLYGQTKYADDAAFLKEHTDVISLELENGSAVLLAPAYQGRVMTSSFDAKEGASFGWINRPVIEQGVLTPEEEKGKVFEKIYIFGGEERFWIGPEGGQFAYFFGPQKDFTLDNWNTPAFIDTDVYAVKDKSTTHATFTHEAELKNQSGHSFKMGIERKIQILDRETMAGNLSVELAEGIKGVGYESKIRLLIREKRLGRRRLECRLSGF